LVVELYQPDLETRVAILRQKAKVDEVDINEDSVNYLANKIQGNAREMEGALHQFMFLARLKNVPISMELIRDSGLL
jgi:chromosomal replication initiator protein